MIKFLYKENWLRNYLLLSVPRLFLASILKMLMTQDQFIIFCIMCGIATALEFLMEDIKMFRKTEEIRLMLIPYALNDPAKRMAWDVIKIYYINGSKIDDQVIRLVKTLSGNYA